MNKRDDDDEGKNQSLLFKSQSLQIKSCVFHPCRRIFLHFPSSPFRRGAHSVHVCFIIAFTMYNFIRLFSEFHIKHFSNLRIGVFQLRKHMGRPDYFQMHLASPRVGVRTDVDVNYLFLFSSGSHTELSRHLFFISLSVKCLRGRSGNEVTRSPIGSDPLTCDPTPSRHRQQITLFHVNDS